MGKIKGWRRDRVLSRSYKDAWKSDAGSTLTVRQNNAGRPVAILQRPPIKRNDGGWEYLPAYSITKNQPESYEEARRVATDYMRSHPNG